MYGTTDILAPMIIKEIEEVGNRACRFALVPKNEAELGKRFLHSLPAHAYHKPVLQFGLFRHMLLSNEVHFHSALHIVNLHDDPVCTTEVATDNIEIRKVGARRRHINKVVMSAYGSSGYVVFPDIENFARLG